MKSENVSTTSGDVPPSDLTFSIAVTELKATSAMVTVTPSNDTETYFFDIQPKKLIDENFADDASLMPRRSMKPMRNTAASPEC